MQSITLDKIRLDGGTQPRAEINMVTVADYAEEMRRGTAFPPVVVFYDGAEYWLADGFHRVGGASGAELVEIAADVRQGTRRDAVLFSVGANASHGMRRTNEDKRRAVLTLLNDEEWKKWSNEKIASACGVSSMFVGNMRREGSSLNSLEIAEPRLAERNGKIYEVQTANIGRLSMSVADDDVDEITPEVEYALDLEESKNARAAGFNVPLPSPESYKTTEAIPHVARNSGNNEWYTPPAYIGAAREVMGVINLDPASSDIANQTVKAEEIFTIADNGLLQEWRGNAWMNPPYAGELIGQFAAKLIEHVANGSVPQAIALVNNATETGWFQQMAEAASAICFPKTRVRFLDPDGNPGAPLQGQAVLYFGENVEQFNRSFSAFGFVVEVKK